MPQCRDLIKVKKFVLSKPIRFLAFSLWIYFPLTSSYSNRHKLRPLARHCATSRYVAASISDGVGIFHWSNLSCRTMTLGLTQPLTEMSTRNIFWGIKAAGAYSWQSLHLHLRIVLKSGTLKLLESSGPLKGLLYVLTVLKFLERPIQMLTNWSDKSYWH
jgi:hypothetical protein